MRSSETRHTEARHPEAKRTLLSILCGIVALVALSFLVSEPFYHTEASYLRDSNLRSQLAGEIDFICVGTSHTLNDFVPAVLDEELGTDSYNMSGLMTTIPGRQYLLEKELDRNPIKTVVLGVSPSTLTRDEHNEQAQGDHNLLAKLDSLGERFKYTFTHVDFMDLPNVYALNTEMGIAWWRLLQLGETSYSHVDYDAKGFYDSDPQDQTLTEEEAVRLHDSNWIDSAFREENIQEWNELCDMCDERGLEVVIVNLPCSDDMLWCNDNWDSSSLWFKEFCQQRGYTYYDFNLLKDRQSLLTDDISFSNQDHLSTEGALAFTERFCQLLQRSRAGEDVSGEFYDDYASMKADSPYTQYLGS